LVHGNALHLHIERGSAHGARIVVQVEAARTKNGHDPRENGVPVEMSERVRQLIWPAVVTSLVTEAAITNVREDENVEGKGKGKMERRIATVTETATGEIGINHATKNETEKVIETETVREVKRGTRRGTVTAHGKTENAIQLLVHQLAQTTILTSGVAQTTKNAQQVSVQIVGKARRNHLLGSVSVAIVTIGGLRAPRKNERRTKIVKETRTKIVRSTVKSHHGQAAAVREIPAPTSNPEATVIRRKVTRSGVQMTRSHRRGSLQHPHLALARWGCRTLPHGCRAEVKARLPSVGDEQMGRPHLSVCGYPRRLLKRRLRDLAVLLPGVMIARVALNLLRQSAPAVRSWKSQQSVQSLQNRSSIPPSLLKSGVESRLIVIGTRNRASSSIFVLICIFFQCSKFIVQNALGRYNYNILR
jgi:hypothetical protein